MRQREFLRWVPPAPIERSGIPMVVGDLEFGSSVSWAGMGDGEVAVDYLVIGAGAAGLAFTDALIAESDATVMLVDRRHGPGGHWNDAYPFVRLHQPSAFYGVNSRNLGDDRIDDTGPNAGFYERATAAEICHYFQTVLDDHLLASGQVGFLPMVNAFDDGHGTVTTVSQLTGEERTTTVTRKVVDASLPRELDPRKSHAELHRR